MTLHDFFVGGTALRILLFAAGIIYCLRNWQYRPQRVLLCHVGSIAVLVLLVFSREWATIIGVPLSALIVEQLTQFVISKRRLLIVEARLDRLTDAVHATKGEQ